LIPRFPVYLFDIDGTLVDSAADICGAVLEVLSKTRCRDVPFDKIKSYIGHHLIDLFQDLLPELSPEEHDALIVEYRAIYPARQHRNTRRYPGTLETVSALGGLKSTATTNGTPTTRIVLEKFGFLPYFDHVQGTDGFPSKPAPDVIFRALDALGAKPADCLLIGDAGPDMEAGRRAGVRTCAVRYGYGDHEQMQRWQPDYWIGSLTELLVRQPRSSVPDFHSPGTS
jgi:HAD superfamily hydrolase (TIGR01509 family)